MPTKGPDRSTSDYSQGRFSGDNGSAESSSKIDGELADLSRNMLIKLGRTIENDVIPRLMLAFETPAAADASARDRTQLIADKVDEFVHLLLHHDTPVATRYVSTLRGSGIPLATIYLDLLGPAARRLGELWESDECSFTDVTIGVCRMHQVLLEFTRCFDAVAETGDKTSNALILPAPGEQHTFGLFMVMEFLRRSGWHCFSGTPATFRDFEGLVEAQEYGVIGISISADRHLERTTKLVRDIRRQSRNRDCYILVGGQVILSDPSLVERIGADGTARDGEEAAQLVQDRLRAQRDTSAD